MTSSSSHAVAVFSLDEKPLALAVAKIIQVVRAVAITDLPAAPRGVLGVIDVHGEIVPVYDLRIRLGRPARALRATDYLVLAQTARRTVALLVDAVIGVVSGEAARVTAPAAILPELRGVQGVLTLEGDVVLIHDLEQFLSAPEEIALTDALGA